MISPPLAVSYVIISSLIAHNVLHKDVHETLGIDRQCGPIDMVTIRANDCKCKWRSNCAKSVAVMYVTATFQHTKLKFFGVTNVTTQKVKTNHAS